MSERYQLLLAIENAELLYLFKCGLSVPAYDISVAQDRVELNTILQQSSPALVIVDQSFSGENGLEIASSLVERFPTMPVLLYLENENLDILAEALKLGIKDCLCSPLRVDEIVLKVENSLKRAKRIRDWTRLEATRKTAVLQERLSELQKMEDVIDQIADGVIITDRRWNIAMMNQSARREFGIWKDNDWRGKQLLEAIPHPSLQAFFTKRKDIIPYHEIVFDDGHVLSARITSVPEIGSVITMRDFTEFTHEERAKREFNQTVTSSLRSPLTALLGYLDSLEKWGSLNDAQRECVLNIHVSVNRINERLDEFSEQRSLVSEINPYMERVYVEDLLNSVLAPMKQKMIEKQFLVKINVCPGKPQLNGNPAHFRKMLEHLIENAVKFTPQGGTISFIVDTPNDQTLIQVTDTGQGIPLCDQPYIFESYFRGSNVASGLTVIKQTPVV